MPHGLTGREPSPLMSHFIFHVKPVGPGAKSRFALYFACRGAGRPL